MTEILALLVNKDIYSNLERIISFVFAVLVGSGVRLGYKSQEYNLKTKYVIFVFSCALLVGYWVDIYATYKGWVGARGAMVSAAALVSESLVSYFFTNEKTIFDDIKQFFVDKWSNKQ